MERNEVYELICNASVLGNLGMFVGAGFTKSILENNYTCCSYNWMELLAECCKRMGTDPELVKSKGSYPEIASQICKQYMENKRGTDEEADYRQACIKLKSVICELVNVYPEEEDKKRFQSYFDGLDINWIVTTNYDTILESILIGKALPLNPAGSFIKIKNMVPVYHIHGIRTNPQSIVITNEDYISMFRPGDYRQARLPFLMKESTVLMVGYGFGDINVISAVDWSRNVYQNIIETCDTDIIQLLYCDPDQIPRPEPYRDESGIIVVEIRSIEEFFEALCQYQLEYTESYNKVVSEVSDHINRFITAKKSDVDQFIDNEEKRKETIDYIEQLRPEFSYIYNSYIGYLGEVFSNLDQRSIPNGAFEAYDEKLRVLLDILEVIDIGKAPPAFFAFLADSLESLAYYIGTNKGQSWKAHSTWQSNKQRISPETVTELQRYAESNLHRCYRLKALLKTIN